MGTADKNEKIAETDEAVLDHATREELRNSGARDARDVGGRSPPASGARGMRRQ